MNKNPIHALFKIIMRIKHNKSLRYSFNLQKILVLFFIKGPLGITLVILVFSIFSRTAYAEGPALVTNLSKYYGILYKSTIPF